MEVFEYRGRTKRGEVVTGTIESPNQEAVADWLLGSGIAPIAISPQVDRLQDLPQWLQRLIERDRLGIRDKLLFTRQMHTMVRSGVPMIQALASIQKSTANKLLIRILRQLRSDLEKGSDLSTALAKHPKMFDDYYVAMVKVGENSGQLEEIFKRLFDQVEFEYAMQRKIKSALRYPIFVLTAVAIALGIMTFYVIPVFASFYSKFGSTLPMMTRILLGTSEFAIAYWWVLVAVFGLIFYGCRIFVSQPAGRYQWDRFKLKLPVIGPILEKASIARFCRALATASKSGVPLVQAFNLVSRVVANAYFEERILLMREGVERGESILRVAQVAGIFSPLELQMIAVGEDTGDVDGMMSQVATMYQEEVEYEVERLAESMEPILMAVLGVLVLILMLGIFLPMWQLGAAVKGKMT